MKDKYVHRELRSLKKNKEIKLTVKGKRTGGLTYSQKQPSLFQNLNYMITYGPGTKYLENPDTGFSTNADIESDQRKKDRIYDISVYLVIGLVLYQTGSALSKINIHIVLLHVQEVVNHFMLLYKIGQDFLDIGCKSLL